MRRVKAEKEEMPIFLAKNVTAKGLNLNGARSHLNVF